MNTNHIPTTGDSSGEAQSTPNEALFTLAVEVNRPVLLATLSRRPGCDLLGSPIGPWTFELRLDSKADYRAWRTKWKSLYRALGEAIHGYKRYSRLRMSLSTRKLDAVEAIEAEIRCNEKIAAVINGIASLPYPARYKSLACYLLDLRAAAKVVAGKARGQTN